MGIANFPSIRMRRLRQGQSLRGLVQETRLSPQDFLYPLFVVHGSGVREEMVSLPGCYHLSVDQLPAEIGELARLGIPGVLLFGIPESKDPHGLEAYDDQGIVQKAIRVIKKESPEMVVITDVCLCEYTIHGHCGIVEDGVVDNDVTLEFLAKTALSHVRSGVDIVAPSDMMDGRVAAIRQNLDSNGFHNVPIMSYAAKYASSFFEPFREAVQSTPVFGDRRGYQMDPANAREGLMEIALDIQEGADIVVVKPALPYLDVIYRAREAFNRPLAAYNVSGEYAMIKAASGNGWLDEERAVLEVLTSIKRAGADLIITYHAKEAAGWLNRDR